MRRHNRPDGFMDMFDSRSDRFNESGMRSGDMDRMMSMTMQNCLRTGLVIV